MTACIIILGKQLWERKRLAVQIVVLGKSLGGAVALHLAASNPKTFKAVIVENTFLSIEDVAPKVSLQSSQHHGMSGVKTAP